MEPRTLLFHLCLSAFIIGSLSKQTKHGFKSILHDNMKEYFKNYMVGNFIGVHEKQFDTLKISKWIGEDVSKQTKLAARDFLINASPNLAEEAETLQPLPANLQRDNPSKVARDSFQNANLVFKKVPELDRNGTLNLAEEAETLQQLPANLQAAAVRKRDNPNEESPDILAWLNEASDRRQKLSNDIDSFFKSWDNVLNISSSGCGETPKIPMSTPYADLSLLGMTPVFMDLFWPFRFDVNVMNQRLAVYDLTKKIITDNETLKEFFFEELQDLQGIRLPVRGNQITFSFGDEDVVDGLNRSRLVPHLKSYMKAGKHLFTKDEQEKILVLANKALDVINKTHSELHRAMVQMISSIAFFKDDSDLYRGGSITSALGLVWLDPRQEWTVPLMAEQIVHEFIHTSLYYAELVHGTYRDVSRLPEAQVMSAIRHVPRNYDKSLHAAYVSAGLITFHTRVGLFDRAAHLAKTLPGAVQELNRVNAETDVLDESGRAMLDFLTDYICLTRV